MDMGNVIIGDIIPRVDNGINGIILFIILIVKKALLTLLSSLSYFYHIRIHAPVKKFLMYHQ